MGLNMNHEAYIGLQNNGFGRNHVKITMKNLYLDKQMILESLSIQFFCF